VGGAISEAVIQLAFGKEGEPQDMIYPTIGSIPPSLRKDGAPGTRAPGSRSDEVLAIPPLLRKDGAPGLM
jgi:hypothetical protein